jgi:hypothetical protein
MQITAQHKREHSPATVVAKEYSEAASAPRTRGGVGFRSPGRGDTSSLQRAVKQIGVEESAAQFCEGPGVEEPAVSPRLGLRIEFIRSQGSRPAPYSFATIVAVEWYGRR